MKPDHLPQAQNLKLLVIIVNFRVPHLLIDCLRSIAPEIERSGSTRVVVVENGSGDDSEKAIRTAISREGWSAWCRLIVSPENLGFTGGNNLPLKEALSCQFPPDYFLLLNPDTLIRPGAFLNLLTFMELTARVGVAGSRLEDPDGSPQRSAFRFITALGEFESNARLAIASKILKDYVIAPPVTTSTPTETDWVAGASMMVRREVFESIGLLDEGFFTYFDDIDLCLRARRSGWKVFYVPDSRVVHLVGQSSGVDGHKRRVPAYVLEARRRFFLKNYSRWYAIRVDLARLIAIGSVLIRQRLLGTADQLPPLFFRDSLMHSVFVRGFKIESVTYAA